MIDCKEERKTPITFVALVVCTCKRTKMLKDCILSANEVILPCDIKAQIIVIDNDPECSAREIVNENAQHIRIPIVYASEPRRGISNARNKGLEEAIKSGASHILFFDDDETLTADTLISHIDLYNKNKAALISSGPTISKFDENYPDYIKKHMVFKQRTTKKTGDIRTSCAAGNVFFPVSLVKENGLRFSDEYVFMGGEDGDFFHKASELGFTIVWNNEAVIYETVPAARANMKYILKKCYYNGYASAYYKFKNSKKTLKKSIYILKTVLVLFVNLFSLILSLFCGSAVFFNTLGRTVRSKGKIDGAIKNTPYNFYKEIYGE